MSLQRTGASCVRKGHAARPAHNRAPEVHGRKAIDLQAKRADIMAKGLTLTAEQAAKFWPRSL
jgi:hypothetical protein